MSNHEMVRGSIVPIKPGVSNNLPPTFRGSEIISKPSRVFQKAQRQYCGWGWWDGVVFGGCWARVGWAWVWVVGLCAGVGGWVWVVAVSCPVVG